MVPIATNTPPMIDLQIDRPSPMSPQGVTFTSVVPKVPSSPVVSEPQDVATEPTIIPLNEVSNECYLISGKMKLGCLSWVLQLFVNTSIQTSI